MAPTRKPSKTDEEGNEYLAKRSRNNAAVRRSREKARMKAKETHERVSQLKQENEMLEERIKLLTKELSFLKDIFLAHAGKIHISKIFRTITFLMKSFFLDAKHGLSIDDLEVRSLLQDDPFDDAEVPR